MRWIIPDVPQQLRQQIRQHAYLTNELILQQEYNRVKEMSNEGNRKQSGSKRSSEEPEPKLNVENSNVEPLFRSEDNLMDFEVGEEANSTTAKLDDSHHGNKDYGSLPNINSDPDQEGYYIGEYSSESTSQDRLIQDK